MKILAQERTNPRQIFPSPAQGERIEETPPCLSWILMDGQQIYHAVIRDANGTVVWQGETTKNYIVPEKLLAPGNYSWNLFCKDLERGWWDFEILKDAVQFLRPKAEEVFNAVPDQRPRHLFFKTDIDQMKRDKSRELEVLKRNIAVARKNGLPLRPSFHRDSNALPYREYFGQYRDYCDRDLVACALGYAILGDHAAGQHAKESLLTICDWSPAGPCSLLGPWGDEVGLSNARCLPSVYDLIYDLLSEKDRIYVEQTIAAYAAQCEERLIQLNFCLNPGESHSGRLPAYLGEAALVLKGTSVPQHKLLRWLDYALDIYGGIFPYYGGPDGGWAEGAFYSTSYTKWFLPFFMAVDRFSGYRFIDRPFYQKLTQYLLHFASPDFENHPFGDGYWCNSEDKEWPGFFAQNPCRLYAQIFGPQLAKKRAYDAATPELYKLHLLDIFIPSAAPPKQHLTGSAENVRSFPYAGFVSLHTDLANTHNDIALLARASRYGSCSHQHPDQGSFALYYKGTALISPSGYFGRQFGTAHHMEWTNSTRAHNAILVNGEGQQNNSFRATGKILSCHEKQKGLFASLDLSASYPMLKVWTRQFEVHREGIVIIRDHIEADEPVEISWLLHTLSQPMAKGHCVGVTRNKIDMEIQPMSGELSLHSITDQFGVDLNEGVPKEFHVTMPVQYHILWKTPKKAVHDIIVEIRIDK